MGEGEEDGLGAKSEEWVDGEGTGRNAYKGNGQLVEVDSCLRAGNPHPPYFLRP